MSLRTVWAGPGDNSTDQRDGTGCPELQLPFAGMTALAVITNTVCCLYPRATVVAAFIRVAAAAAGVAAANGRDMMQAYEGLMLSLCIRNERQQTAVDGCCRCL